MIIFQRTHIYIREYSVSLSAYTALFLPFSQLRSSACVRVCIYVYSHHVRHVAGGGELLCFSTRTLSSSLFLSPGDLSRLPCARARFFLFSVSCLSALPPSSPSILFRSTHAFSSQRSMRRIEGERDFFFSSRRRAKSSVFVYVAEGRDEA